MTQFPVACLCMNEGCTARQSAVLAFIQAVPLMNMVRDELVGNDSKHKLNKQSRNVCVWCVCVVGGLLMSLKKNTSSKC